MITYRLLLRFLYYRGDNVIEYLYHALLQYHVYNTDHFRDSSPFFDHITRKLEGNLIPRDVKNILSVILADLFAQPRFFTAHGFSLETVEQELGEVARSILSMVMQEFRSEYHKVRYQRPVDPVTENELCRFIALITPHRVSEYLEAAPIPETLPLVDLVRQKFGTINPEVKCAVFVQHLFASTVPMIQALAGDHIAPEGVFILGKPYSTNYATLLRLRSKGFFIHPGSVHYEGGKEYHEEADQHIDSLLERAILYFETVRTSPEHKILLVDDGGRAIRMLHQARYAKWLPSFCFVEQTRRGIRELQDLDLKAPVMNVAESRAKLEFESPLIAESILTELNNTLRKVEEIKLLRSRKFLVVGFGAIGQAVAKEVHEKGFEVGVYDIDASKVAHVDPQLYTVENDLVQALPKYNIILGCTGYQALDFNMYEHISNGSILVSGSSSDVEFSSWKLRSIASAISDKFRYNDDYNLVIERYGDQLLYLGDTDYPCYFLYLIRFKGKEFFLVNGGFPINMTGDFDPIPPEKIQLTRALLYYAGVAASYQQSTGLIPLPVKDQAYIIEQFCRLQQ